MTDRNGAQLRTELEELRQHLAELQESEERYRALGEAAQDCIYIIDRDGQIAYVNAFGARLLGQEPHELVGRTPQEVFPPGAFERQQSNLQRVLESGQPVYVEDWTVFPGLVMWQNTSLSPLRAEDGSVKAVLGISRDITEHKKAEEALRTSEQQYRSTIDAMRDWIHVVDPHLRIVLCNAALNTTVEQLGLGKDIIGRTVLEVFPFLPDSVRAEYRQVFRTGEILSTEESTRVGDQEFVTETRKIPVIEEGSVTRVVTVIHDITKQKRIEEALRQSESQFRGMVEHSFDAIASVDLEGRITYVSPAVKRTLQYEPEELIGHFFHEDMAEEEQAKAAQALARATRGESVEGLQLQLWRKDGSPFYIEANLAPMYKGEEVVGIQGIYRDITAHREAVEALKENERFLQSIFDAIRDGISILDRDLTVIRVNQWMEQMYAEQQPLVGKKCYVVYQHRTSVCPWCPSVHTLETGEPNSGIVPYPSGDHPTGWIELSAFPLRDAEGRLQGVIEYVKDITERVQTEEALRESEARYRTLVETSPDAITLTGLDGSILMLNQQALEMYGVEDAQTIVGRSAFDFVAAEDRPRAIENAQKVLDTGSIRAIEYTMIREDGTPFPVELSASLVVDAQGQPQAFIGVTRDLTERRRLEEQFRQSQKMETVGRLAGGIAHDFNNLLTAIEGYASLALDALDPTDPVYQDVDEVLRSAERASSLVDKLLAFSRRQIIEQKVLDLNDLVSNLEKMLSRLIGEEIELGVLPASVPCLVKVDPGQIEQVLVNLAVNARDAMPHGGKVAIRTAPVQTVEQPAWGGEIIPDESFILLAVSDNGVGMTEAIQAHLFEPFFTTKEAGQGTGLGLATVYGIIKQHQGYLAVDSEPGRGTTFRIYFPRVDGDIEELPTIAAGEPVPRGTETVLVAEDEPAVRAFVVHALRKLGYDVLEAAEANQAIRLIRQVEGKVDLLVTDVVMPQIDGKILSGLLQDVFPRIKVLYVSGYTAQMIAQRGILQEGIAFLAKPFTIAELAHKVREVLDMPEEPPEDKDTT